MRFCLWWTAASSQGLKNLVCWVRGGLPQSFLLALWSWMLTGLTAYRLQMLTGPFQMSKWCCVGPRQSQLHISTVIYLGRLNLCCCCAFFVRETDHLVMKCRQKSLELNALKTLRRNPGGWASGGRASSAPSSHLKWEVNISSSPWKHIKQRTSCGSWRNSTHQSQWWFISFLCPSDTSDNLRGWEGDWLQSEFSLWRWKPWLENQSATGWTVPCQQ